ncbi:MAG: HigA family addiction module antitoxin [bacterium]|nr:HigA family addiction module antitoxin [bacterium]MDE0242611.1 HigA family addiction module antitoxin [bacterium]MDE0419096.1 HigA family addiction module antitoxin [bacterium]
MTIDREELDRLEVDFSDVASGRRLHPVHPGTILRDDFLEPMRLSVYRLARDIKVSRPRLNEIVRGRRAVTVDSALRLARYFGTTPEFWINLQARYDLDVAERTVRRVIDREVAPRAA